jgi:hypothetical protein
MGPYVAPLTRAAVATAFDVHFKDPHFFDICLIPHVFQELFYKFGRVALGARGAVYDQYLHDHCQNI